MRLGSLLLLLCAAAGMATAQTFTTVAEVKPILTATQATWIAVRETQGKDLVYFTQIESWRCGLREIRYSINGGPETVKPMEPCYTDAPSPNAFQDAGHKPYVAQPGGSVQSVSVTVVYADGSTGSASFERAQIAIN